MTPTLRVVLGPKGPWFPEDLRGIIACYPNGDVRLVKRLDKRPLPGAHRLRFCAGAGKIGDPRYLYVEGRGLVDMSVEIPDEAGRGDFLLFGPFEAEGPTSQGR